MSRATSRSWAGLRITDDEKSAVARPNALLTDDGDHFAVLEKDDEDRVQNR